MGAAEQQLAEALQALEFVRRRSARFVVTEEAERQCSALTDIHDVATRALSRLGGAGVGASQDQSTLPGV